jgi:NAD(P)-dependent dehydrogenase (short-subunit alcohol dehydrogenase family)
MKNAMALPTNHHSSMNQKIAIITGANIGLGYETAKTLAKEGIKIIMACRNLVKAEVAKDKIIKKVPNAQLEMIHLDLNSLHSVREFADEFKARFDRLDILILNAGILIPPFTKTVDGFESQMGVNYFGHFLLTNLLFEVLNKTPNARVVTLSSPAYKKGKINFENLNSEKGYSKSTAYEQSKLACLMFSYELQRRIEKSGSGVISVAAHPGLSKTNLGQHTSPIFMVLFTPLFFILGHSPEKAARSIVMTAIDNKVKGGDFYGPNGYAELKGKPRKLESTASSRNIEIARRLWECSEILTGQKFAI